MKTELLQNKEAVIIKKSTLVPASPQASPGEHPKSSAFSEPRIDVQERRSRGSVKIAVPAMATVGIVLWDEGAPPPPPLYNPPQCQARALPTLGPKCPPLVHIMVTPSSSPQLCSSQVLADRSQKA